MASSFIYRTNVADGNKQKFTHAFWVKRCGLGVAWNNLVHSAYAGNTWRYSGIAFTTDNELTAFSGNYQSGSTGSTALYDYTTNRKFVDVGAWYHIVVAVDTTIASPASDRVKIFVNGVRETSFSTASDPSVNGSTYFNADTKHSTFGATNPVAVHSPGAFVNGVLSHCYWIDGTAYDASTFGEVDATSGIWRVKDDISVTYGTNGFFLKMEDRTNLDLDSGTNGFTMTTTGTITPTYDSPSNNFCTLNPIASDLAGGSLTLGNNYVQFASDSTYRSIYATLGNSTGKYYFEGYVQDDGNATNIGIIDTEQNTGSNQDYTAQSRGYSYNEDGQKYNNGSGSSYGDTYASTNIIGCAVDLTNGAIWFSKNGTWQNSATIAEIGAGTTTNAAFTGLTLGASYLYGPAISGKTNAKWKMNFGNGYFADTAISSEGTNASGIGSFEYDVPTGFTAWSTKGFNE